MSARIDNLKAVARGHYLSYQAATEHLDCGAALTRHMCSPEAAEHARQFNEIMNELATIDPTTPKARL